MKIDVTILAHFPDRSRVHPLVKAAAKSQRVVAPSSTAVWNPTLVMLGVEVPVEGLVLGPVAEEDTIGVRAQVVVAVAKVVRWVCQK